MKSKFIAMLFGGMLPVLAFAQDINFDDLRRTGTPLVKSYTVTGAGAEGSGAVMKFGEIDNRRVDEANARRRQYAASGGGSAPTSNSNTKNGSSTSSGTAKNSAPARGVERITDNGKLSGVPSHRVQCRSGSSHIIYYKNGTWWHGLYGHTGNELNSWSAGQVGEHFCK